MEHKKTFFLLAGLHAGILLIMLIAVIMIGRDYHFLLLVDDGYYGVAGAICDGNLSGNWVGLGYPLVLTPLYLFPEYLHPFVRLFISLIFSLITLSAVLKIATMYKLTSKQVLYGAIAFMLNPLYLHWVFKSRPEPVLAALLGFFILFAISYFRTNKKKYLVFSMIFIFLGIITKPIFMLAPVFLIIISLYIKHRTVVKLGFVSLIVSLSAFFLMKIISDIPHYDEDSQYYSTRDIAFTGFYVNAIVENRSFKTQYLTVEENGKEVRNPRLKPYYEWKENVIENYGSSSSIGLSFRYIVEKPGLFLQSLILNPFLLYSLSSSEFLTVFNFLINTIFLILTFWGINKLDKNYKNDIIIYLAIIFSIWALYVLFHSRGPYFLPLIPFLFVFSGIPIAHILQNTRLDKLLSRFIN